MSTSLRILVVVLLWAAIVAVGYIVLRRLRQRNDALLRFQRDTTPADNSAREGESFGWLRRQMMLAGFSRPEAGFLMLVFSGLMLIVGAACALVFRWSGLQQQVLEGIELVPGGLAGILAPIAILSPWLITHSRCLHTTADRTSIAPQPRSTKFREICHWRWTYGLHFPKVAWALMLHWTDGKKLNNQVARWQITAELSNVT